MAAKTITPLTIADDKVKASLADARKALSDGDLVEYQAKLIILKKDVDDRNTIVKKQLFNTLASKKNPIIDAIKMFTYEVSDVKENKNKDTGIVNGIEIKPKNKRIDLKEFCEATGIETKWANACGELRALLHLREVKLFEIKPDLLAKESLYFASVASKKKSGATPDSNTQIVRKIQECIDLTLGKGVYRCTNHDIEFIGKCFTKQNVKEKCTICTCNDRQFRNLMLDVFAHALGTAEYRVVDTQKKDKSKTEQPKTTEAAA
jgi:hypothetical protein